MNPNFGNATFIKSCLEEKDFPTLYASRNTPFPEIAMIGRSNSGKSSLINHLTQRKKLVFVSSTPGKTQLINFFNIDEQLLLVDLPGYGFAKVDKQMKKTWGTTLSHYLENRPQLSLLILLLDIRRDPSEEDIQMIQWAQSLGKELLFVFSKKDKLSKSDFKKREAALLASLTTCLGAPPSFYLPYSIKESSCRLLLKNVITTALKQKGIDGTAN